MVQILNLLVTSNLNVFNELYLWYFCTDRMDLSMDRNSGRANSCSQRRVHTNGQKESFGNVPVVGLGEGHIPLRRATEEISVGPVSKVNGVSLT